MFASDSSLKIHDHLKRLAKQIFLLPHYKPRWGNSIIEAAAFDCLIIGIQIVFK